MNAVAEMLEVLVVEDNPADSAFVAALLAEASGDYRMTAAVRVSEALEKLRSDAFGVILLDLSLPDAEGLEVVRAILPAAGAAPVIVLTGSDDEEMAERALGEGCQDYLVKNAGDADLLRRSIRYALARKGMERRLTATEERLQVLSRATESSPAVVIITDASGHIEYVNPRFSHVTGYAAEEVIGRNPRLLSSGKVPPEVYADLWRTVAAGRVWQGEFENRRKDGTPYWASAAIAPITDAEGRITHLVGLQEDVTERKRTMQALRRNAALFQLLHSITAAANETLDPEIAMGRCLDAICGFFGWPLGHLYLPAADGSEQLLSSRVWHLESPERFRAFRELTERTHLRKGEGLPGRVWESGRPAWIEDVTRDASFLRTQGLDEALGVKGAFAFPVLTGREVVAVLEFFSPESAQADDAAVFETVTHIGIQLGRVVERQRAERTLRAAKEQAEAANRAKSDFLSGMSHELRTPLNAILGFAQLLESNPFAPLEERQRRYVEHILNGGRHLLELIDEVLDLARVEAGKLRLSFESVAPAELVADCLALALPMAEKRGLTIEDRVQGAVLPNVRLDFVRAKQVLLNFLSNAVKYNRDGGTVRIECLGGENGRLRFQVSDTGLGIPDGRRNEIFQPFSRLGREGSDVEGTGIGLALTKQLVEEMHGTIGFTSVEGRGSSFFADFPIAETAAVEATADPDAETPASPDTPGFDGVARTLLYVDDDRGNLELMGEVAGRIPGLRVVTARNAEIGLKLAEAIRPDLIVLDINLPGLNGIEALRELRRRSATREIPILAFSSDAMEATIEKAMAAGFQAYLTKPIDVHRLEAALLQAISALASGK